MVQKGPVRLERRWLAILVSDVVGYSRLVYRGQEGTHAKLAVVLAEMSRPRIAEHRGHIEYRPLIARALPS
jgi:class 3 adenylate cyclase